MEGSNDVIKKTVDSDQSHGKVRQKMKQIHNEDMQCRRPAVYTPMADCTGDQQSSYCWGSTHFILKSMYIENF